MIDVYYFRITYKPGIFRRRVFITGSYSPSLNEMAENLANFLKSLFKKYRNCQVESLLLLKGIKKDQEICEYIHTWPAETPWPTCAEHVGILKKNIIKEGPGD